MNIDKAKLKDFLFAAIAGTIAAFNIKSFISAGGLVSAGFSGISLLTVRIGKTFFDLTIPYSMLYFTINIPVMIFVVKYIGKHFTLTSMVFVLFSSFMVDLIPEISITQDMLLIAVFGGIINGCANSLVLMANGCGGGMDFISIYFSIIKHMSVWNYSFLINTFIISISGLLFGWDSALYSIIYQFVSTQVIKMFDSRYKRTSFFIITEQADQIIQEVYQQLNHSVTILEGVGSYSHQTKKVLYTVVGEYEQTRLIHIVTKIDPKAFINMMTSSKIVGNFHEKQYS